MRGPLRTEQIPCSGRIVESGSLPVTAMARQPLPALVKIGSCLAAFFFIYACTVS